MQISLDTPTNEFHIQSYSDGIITVNRKSYQQPIVLTLDTLATDPLLTTIESLDEKYLMEIGFQQHEVVLIGTGLNLVFPDWELIEFAQMKGTPLELMATGAACRTFTALAGEGRKVLAILFP